MCVIGVSGVTLDLNGNTVTAISENQDIQGTVGIRLFSASDIVIKNGTLAGFHRAGIYADGLERFEIENIKTKRCGRYTKTSLGGIFLLNAKTGSIRDCVCDASIPFGISGAALEDVVYLRNKITETTSTAANNMFGFEIAAGIFLGDTFTIANFKLNFPSRGVRVKECEVSRVHNKALSFGLNLSAFLDSTTFKSAIIEDCLVTHCFIESGASPRAEIVGLDGVNIDNLIIRRCKVSDLVNESGGGIDGLVVSANGALVEDCSVTGISCNSSSGTVTISGFIVESVLAGTSSSYNDIRLLNCRTENIVNRGTNEVAGFRVIGLGSIPGGDSRSWVYLRGMYSSTMPK